MSTEEILRALKIRLRLMHIISERMTEPGGITHRDMTELKMLSEETFELYDKLQKKITASLDG